MTDPLHRRAAAITASATLAVALLAAGCGGADPTTPRAVRAIDAERSSAGELPPRDEQAPSRGLPCDAQGSATIRLCGAATDNYKASYNEDPEAPELRTWLAIHQLEFDDARWQPAADTPLTADAVSLERLPRSGDSETMAVRAEVVGGPGASVVIRTGPQRGLWGPLLTLQAREALELEPVVVRLTVADHSIDVTYRYDRALARASESSLEHGSPGGRWVVADVSTATNLELGWE